MSSDAQRTGETTRISGAVEVVGDVEEIPIPLKDHLKYLLLQTTVVE